VCRGAEYLSGWTLLNDFAGVHHGHPIGAAGNDIQIVADHEHRQVPCRNELAEQVHDSRLGWRIEPGRRFISNEKRRITSEAQREHYALPEAARQLVRVVAGALRWLRYVYGVQQVEHALIGIPPGHDAVRHQRFADLITNREDRIECRGGVLRHEGDLATANLLHRRVVQSGQIAGPPVHRTSRDAT
jgi:hypothetical protein